MSPGNLGKRPRARGFSLRRTRGFRETDLLVPFFFPQLEMEDGDSIDAMMEQVGGN